MLLCLCYARFPFPFFHFLSFLFLFFSLFIHSLPFLSFCSISFPPRPFLFLSFFSFLLCFCILSFPFFLFLCIAFFPFLSFHFFPFASLSLPSICYPFHFIFFTLLSSPSHPSPCIPFNMLLCYSLLIWPLSILLFPPLSIENYETSCIPKLSYPNPNPWFSWATSILLYSILHFIWSHPTLSHSKSTHWNLQIWQLFCHYCGSWEWHNVTNPLQHPTYSIYSHPFDLFSLYVLFF